MGKVSSKGLKRKYVLSFCCGFKLASPDLYFLTMFGGENQTENSFSAISAKNQTLILWTKKAVHCVAEAGA